MHALDLPEIRSLIGTFLNTPDLAVCLRVSKSWNASLLPLLWNKVELSKHSSNAHLRLSLGHHAHLLQSLHLRPIALPSNNDPIPVSPLLNLKTLHLNVNAESVGTREDVRSHLQLCEQILRNCPEVDNLHINFSWIKTDISSLFYLLKDRCPLLRTLRMEAYSFTAKTMDLFLDLCPRLVSLYLENTRQVNVPRINNSGKNDDVSCKELLGIRHLVYSYVDDPYSAAVQFVALFRSVQTLDLHYIYQNDTALGQLADLAVAGVWPYLDRLIVRNKTYPGTDDAMARILGSMKVCRTFQYPRGDVGPKTMEQLSRHFSTLESFVVKQIMDPDRKKMREWVPRVMTSCPKLTQLEVGHLDSEIVMQGPAWVCLGLTRFKVEIFERKYSDLARNYTQEDMCDRLGQLSQLEDFWMGTYGWSTLGAYWPMIDLKVGRGVKKLAGWKKLRRLTIEGVPQELGKEDVDWMIKHWPRLESVVGRLNEDAVVNVELAEYGKEKGIEYHASHYS